MARLLSPAGSLSLRARPKPNVVGGSIVPAKRPPHARGSKGQEKRTWSRPSGMGGKMVQTGQTQAMRNRLKRQTSNPNLPWARMSRGGKTLPQRYYQQQASEYIAQLHQQNAENAYNYGSAQTDRAAYYRQSNPWYRNRYGRMNPQSLRLRQSSEFLRDTPDTYNKFYRKQQGRVKGKRSVT
jgi:hypothetical protein